MYSSMRILGLCLLFPGSMALAQTGPGGVGNSTTNILWLSADHGVLTPTFGVQQWSDRSGNANHAVQSNGLRQPLLATSVMNGYPAVLFDNDQTNADRLTIADNATLEGMNGLSAFAVYQLNTGTASSAPRGILSKRNDPAAQNAYGWFLWDSGGNVRQHLDIDGTGDRVVGSSNRNTGVAYLDGFVYHGAMPSNANDQSLYTANMADGNRQESSTSIPNYASDLHLGSLYGHTGSGANTTRFNGYIAEVVMYNQAVSPVQRLLISNYLAAKYGLTLGADDLYTQDNPGNGNYDHDVAGIGRVNGSDQHTTARGSGIVEIGKSTYSGLNNDEYLLWGHDNAAMDAWGVTDFPATMQGRVARVWRVSEVSSSGTSVDVGNVDITFDLAGLGPVTASDLRLLVDTDGDGLFADETPIAGATNPSGTLYRFSNSNALANGRRFTIGTINALNTPLPIELIAFNAQANGPGSVHLLWSTASERNNALFEVERSVDLDDWTVVAEQPGAINSSSVLHYSAVDASAPEGLVYYRLRQTDLDGATEVSDAVAVVVEGVSDLGANVFPNPTAGPITVTLTGAITGSPRLELFDASGRSVPRSVEPITERTYRLDLSDLPPGMHVLRVWQGGRVCGVRLIRL